MTPIQFVILTTAAAGILFFVIFITILFLPDAPKEKEMHEIQHPPDTGYKCFQEQYDK